ncbi:hypothetical protein BST81_16885 [Leptolyngbya sp. 'hensonii']|nr:hypothetical protein BST81_16885 [Leptolyngbya sp. 'hensonii']
MPAQILFHRLPNHINFGATLAMGVIANGTVDIFSHVKAHPDHIFTAAFFARRFQVSSNDM